MAGGWFWSLLGKDGVSQASVDPQGGVFVSSNQVQQRSGGITPQPNYIGCQKMYLEKDAGVLTGNAALVAPYGSLDDRMSVGLDTPLFDYDFNTAAQDTGAWFYSTATMVASYNSAYVLLNAGASVAATVGVYLQSKRVFSTMSNGGLRFQAVLQLSAAFATGQSLLFGFGIPASATAGPADGAYFSYSNAGLTGVVNYTGTLTTVALQGAITPSVYKAYAIYWTETAVEFWIGGNLAGAIALPAASTSMFLNTSLPVFFQTFNTAAPSTAAGIRIASVRVDQQDVNLGIPFPHIQALKGLARQGLAGGTQGALSFFTNSANPTAAVPVNTGLTANLPSLMQGGIGLATLWNLAATDMVMHQALNPVGSVSQPARTMVVTGVRISALTFTAAWTAPAAGGHALLWSTGFGNTAASLATAESASLTSNTVKTNRRANHGMMTWATGAAAIGTPPDRGDIVVTFQSPIVVNPGEYIETICRMVNGAATASGALLFTVDYDHYFI